MPSTRTRTLTSAAVGALALVGTVSAQSPGSELGLGVRIGIRFVVSLVIYLLLGGALYAVGPRYAAEMSETIRRDPVSAFGWGLLVSIGLPFALVLLAFTVIGLIVAIPGFLVLIPVTVLGTAVTVVTVGGLLTDERGQPSGTVVLAGALALAISAAVPALGDFITGFATLFGAGAVGRGLYRSWLG